MLAMFDFLVDIHSKQLSVFTTPKRTFMNYTEWNIYLSCSTMMTKSLARALQSDLSKWSKQLLSNWGNKGSKVTSAHHLNILFWQLCYKYKGH